MSRVSRTAWGIVASPIPVALLWSSLAIGSPLFLPVFLLCGAVSHLILRRMNLHRLRDYVRVMFWVATVLLFCAQVVVYQFIFGSGGSEFHLGIYVIRDGAFSVGGLALLAFQAMFVAVGLAISFAIFWYFAVRPYATVPGDDA
jgi:hypothetical protein